VVVARKNNPPPTRTTSRSPSAGEIIRHQVAAEPRAIRTASPDINLRDLVVGFADIGDAAVGVPDLARYFMIRSGAPIPRLLM
jgi:hypothetical protein